MWVIQRGYWGHSCTQRWTAAIHMVTGCPSAIHVAHKDRNKGTREEVRDVGPINILCNILYCDFISQSYVFTRWRCYLRKNEVATWWRMRAIQRETKPKERYHCDWVRSSEEPKWIQINSVRASGLQLVKVLRRGEVGITLSVPRRTIWSFNINALRERPSVNQYAVWVILLIQPSH